MSYAKSYAKNWRESVGIPGELQTQATVINKNMTSMHRKQARETREKKDLELITGKLFSDNFELCVWSGIVDPRLKASLMRTALNRETSVSWKPLSKQMF